MYKATEPRLDKLSYGTGILCCGSDNNDPVLFRLKVQCIVYSVPNSLEVTARVSPIQKLTASGSDPTESKVRNTLENL